MGIPGARTWKKHLLKCTVSDFSSLHVMVVLQWWSFDLSHILILGAESHKICNSLSLRMNYSESIASRYLLN